MRDLGGGRLGIDLQVKELRSRWVDVYREDANSGRMRHNVQIECPRRKCPYRNEIGYGKLLAELRAELARSASGHAEHRLTT